jgi:diaminohydroxyphosphoribosylaminopyrimidine deaminase / 5-amino-6-(5-phosphoribosylamino)uracil reductase
VSPAFSFSTAARILSRPDMTDAELDAHWMRRALALARRGLGKTSPNPMVGAVLARERSLLGEGWHHRAGLPHAEVEALRNAAGRGSRLRGATLYVTLEPCCTHGRTPPCTDAIIASGVRRVVVAAVDPNPKHGGRGLKILGDAGIEVVQGLLAAESNLLNRAFNQWITTGRPWFILKAAMTLDGKIATEAGESRWITGTAARSVGMRLRRASDAVMVGVGTVVADDPQLTVRRANSSRPEVRRRIVLDPNARTPLSSRLVNDEFASHTTIVVTPAASQRRRDALAAKANVLEVPESNGTIDLHLLAAVLGKSGVTQVLVEGGGATHGAVLEARLANEVAFFHAPFVLGGRNSRKAVAGPGFTSLAASPRLISPRWRRVGDDLLMTAEVAYPSAG